jgi:hypothetical protein
MIFMMGLPVVVIVFAAVDLAVVIGLSMAPT